MNSTLNEMPSGLSTLAKFVKNAIIADAIGTVDLNDIPPEIEGLVSVAIDKWDAAADDALDVMAGLIVVTLILSMPRRNGDSAPPPVDPRSNFPRF